MSAAISQRPPANRPPARPQDDALPLLPLALLNPMDPKSSPPPGQEERSFVEFAAECLISSPGTQSKSLYNKARKILQDCLEMPADDAAGEPGQHTASKSLKVYFCSHLSMRALPGYASLVPEHVDAVVSVSRVISSYLADLSLERPLNFLMIASPGTGKSHLVKCIGKSLGLERCGVVSFNMATMESKDDLAAMLDAARNVVVDRKLPLVLLDEFDSTEANYPQLLPLLWDGTLNVGSRGDLRIGRSVFFLAGSRPTLKGELDTARRVTELPGASSTDNKIGDLISRINGVVVEVPPLSKDNSGPDRILLAIELLRRRFVQCERVPWALLAFIGRVRFRYDARSIETLINLIPIDPAPGHGAREISEIRIETLRAMADFQSAENLKQSPMTFHLIDQAGLGLQSLVDEWTRCLQFEGEQLIRLPREAKDQMSRVEDMALRYRSTKPSYDRELLLSELFSELGFLYQKVLGQKTVAQMQEEAARNEESPPDEPPRRPRRRRSPPDAENP